MRDNLPTIIKEKAGAIAGDLSRIRRVIHQYPEIGFKEYKTSKLISERLQALVIPCKTGIGKTGVVGVIEGKCPGPVIGLRAEMDALPIQEESAVSYLSQTTGIMHACGHDAHIACLLGAAELLVSLKDKLMGTVKLIFQPAEELDGGAKAMLADGVLDAPRPDAIFALHVDPDLPVGSVGLKEGPLYASIDELRITVTGQGGHGALPHRGIDAIVAASAIVMNLQTAVSREIDPIQPVVVTIGTFNGGRAGNIMASRVDLTGTVRCVDPDIRASLPGIIERICRTTASSFRAGASCEYRELIPPLVNSPEMTGIVKESAAALLGAASIKEDSLTMLGDDFSIFLDNIPGAYFHLGIKSPGRGESCGLHTSCFDIDENALPVGAALLALIALRVTNPADRQIRPGIRESGDRR